MKTSWSMLIAVLLATVSAGRSMAAVCTSTAIGGNWGDTSTWTGGAVPDANDVAVIVPGATVTVTADAITSTLNFDNTGSNAATVIVNSGTTLKIKGAITCKNSATGNTSVLLQGGGSLTCTTFILGGTTTPTVANSDFFVTVTSTIADLSIAGNLRIKSLYNATVSAANQGELRISSGSVTSGNTVEFTTVPFFGPILNLATGAQSGTLNLNAGTPFSFTGGGSYTFTPNGSNATVVYNAASQTVLGATYQNLFLAGSGTKTTTGVTVNGTLSRRGTATVSALPTYGPAATLEYKGSSAQTNGPELAANLPNLTIDNANGVTLAANTTVSSGFSLVNGKINTGANQLNLGASAVVSGGSASNYVNGNLQKTFNVGTASFTFPIGDASAFAPVTISNLAVTASGSIKVTTTAGNHPQIVSSGIDSNKAVSRYWTLTQSGGTFGNADTAFSYNGADVDAGAVAADFAARRYNGGSWSSTYVAGVPTTNCTRITGQIGFGDFVIGDLPPVAQTASGSYTGNGTDNRSIPVAFQPDVVIVKSVTAQTAVIRSSTMPGEGTKDMTGATALQTNEIQSLDVAGFTVGTNAKVNGNGVTYHWVAFKACDGKMKVGSYSGNGTPGRSITNVGFSPLMVFFMSASAQSLVFHSTSSTLSFQLDAHAGNTMVNSLDANGFTLGTDSRVNGNGITYHYVAWASVPGENNGSTYAGNGADNRSITNAGFKPDFVMVKPFAATAAVHHAHSIGDATDSSQYFTATTNVSNRIQALQSTGFQVGTANEVNQSAVTYFSMAWKRTVVPSKLAITSINGGAPVNVGTPFTIVVEAQDALGTAGEVRTATAVSLSLNTGGGTLSGELTGLIPAGASSVTITGVKYSKADSGVVLTVSRTAGDILTAGNSSPFTVGAGAFTKLQVLLPGETAAPGTPTGKTGSPSPQAVGTAFNVRVNAVDEGWNPISTNDVVAISSSDASALLPANVALASGSTIVFFTFSNAGPQTITASDVIHPAIISGTNGLTLDKGAQTISFPYPGDQTYNGQTIDPGATASSGLPVSYAVLSGPGTISSNQLKLTGAGTVLLEVTQPGNSNWNPATPISGFAIAVLPKTITASITVSNKVYDGFAYAPLASSTLSGVVGNDDVALAPGFIPTFADKNAGVDKVVSASGLTLSGTNAGSYVLSNSLVTTVGTITPAPLVITAIAGNKTYDGQTNATVVFTDNRIGDDLFVCNYASATFADKNAGVGKSVLVSGIFITGLDAGNYVANSNATTTATIFPALLTVTANSTNRPYGSANPAFTASYQGFVNGEGQEVLSGTPELSTTADALSPVGTYSITATNGTLASTNYTFGFSDGTLTVTMPRPALTIEYRTDSGSGTNYVVVHASGLPPGTQVKVEASTDSKQWTQVATLQVDLGGSLTHTDVDVAQHPIRFYRFVSQ